MKRSISIRATHRPGALVERGSQAPAARRVSRPTTTKAGVASAPSYANYQPLSQSGQNHVQHWRDLGLTRLPSSPLPSFASQALIQAKRSYSTVAADTSDGRVLRSVLSAEQEKLFHDEQAFLEALSITLREVGASKDDVQVLQIASEQLRDAFLLVIVGEFNSGKSSFLNAMLGHKYLTEGVTPTTANVNILRHGEKVERKNVKHINGVEEKDQLEVNLPVDWLKQISLVDTPGTNAVITAHQQITEHFVPRSDMVLFITSTDRPFTESERAFLDKIRNYKKNVVIVLSKIDMLEEEDQLQEITAFVKKQAKELLDIDPLIFPVSARKAIKAKVASKTAGSSQAEQQAALQGNQMWRESRFGALETYILNSLSAQERALLKLKNPLGVAEHMIKKYEQEFAERKKAIQVDLDIIKRVEGALEYYAKDMNKEFQYHLDRIDNILLKMSERGILFLDTTLALTNIIELGRGDKLKTDFEEKVIGETNADVEKALSETIDWLVEKYARVWNNIVDFTQRQATANESKVVGTLRTQYTYNRQALLSGLGESAKRVVHTFDRHTEAQKLSNEMRSAMFQTAVFELSAVGIVCIYVYFGDQLRSLFEAGTLFTFSLVDVTGLLGITSLAAVGLGVLPFKRRQLKAALSEQINEVRKKLRKTLTDHYTSELQRGISDIRTNLAPYAHFVDKEAGQLEQAEVKLQEAIQSIAKLNQSVSSAFPK